MKRALLTVIAMAALLFVPQRPHVTGAQPAAQLPPGPRTVHHSMLEIDTPPAPLDAVQMVLDFAPGAWTHAHWHGGPLLVTVIEGEIAMRQQGTERTFTTGDLWVEYPGVVHAAGDTMNTTATVVVSFLIPQGGASPASFSDCETVRLAGCCWLARRVSARPGSPMRRWPTPT